jgi:hypothetical protein
MHLLGTIERDKFGSYARFPFEGSLTEDEVLTIKKSAPAEFYVRYKERVNAVEKTGIIEVRHLAKKAALMVVMLLSFLFASAQVKKDVSRVIVGNVSRITTELSQGLKIARQQVGNYQIALISARPFNKCYYVISDLSGRVLYSGQYSARKAGEVKVINVGVLASQCNIKFTQTPLIANN